MLTDTLACRSWGLGANKVKSEEISHSLVRMGAFYIPSMFDFLSSSCNGKWILP
jgi:hypothetical protein